MLIRFFLLVSCIFSMMNANAIPCGTSLGTVYYNFNITNDLINVAPGNISAWNYQTASGSYYFTRCDGSQSIYFTAQAPSNLHSESYEGDTVWYSIDGNPYAEIASQVAVYDAVSRDTLYHGVPFNYVSNNCSLATCINGQTAATGSRAAIRIRTKRPVVGSLSFNTDIAHLYANNVSGDSFGQPIVRLNLSAEIKFPESCVFNTGEVLQIDFGNIPNADFARAGKGSKPMTANKVSHNLGIECKNIEVATSLFLTLQSNKAEDNYIKSNNADVGFQVADQDHRVLIPNDLTSTLPFTLDQNSKANVLINVWPINTTGNKPEPGAVRSEAFLRVDFN